MISYKNTDKSTKKKLRGLTFFNIILSINISVKNLINNFSKEFFQWKSLFSYLKKKLVKIIEGNSIIWYAARSQGWLLYLKKIYCPLCSLSTRPTAVLKTHKYFSQWTSFAPYSCAVTTIGLFATICYYR